MYNGGGNADHADKALKAYTIYTASDGYIRDWVYLPAGLVFHPTARSSTGDNNIFDSAFLTDIPWPSSTSSVQQIHCLVFAPDGSRSRAIGAFDDTEVFLTDGFMVLDEQGYPEKPNHKGPQNLWLANVEFAGNVSIK